MLPCTSLARRGGSIPRCLKDGYNLARTRSLNTKLANKVVFSGIQPTGVPHLGNYLGALREWVRLQDESDPSTNLIYSLVDLHAITIRQDTAQLRQWRKESLAMLLAIGLDPNRSTIFHQSDVPAHAELMWILSCQASTGYLSRMTQWKDKTSHEKGGSERLKLGLFSYPVLQAADVLVHRTTHVPVGHDQAQHLEFAREVAIGFNHVYGAGILTPPETIISPARRVMSLSKPASKMSKSDTNPKSRILLTDSTETIKAKINSAVTDSVEGISYDPENRPGVTNLIDMLYYSLGREAQGTAATPEDMAGDMKSMHMRVLKQRTAEAVDKLVAPIREKYAEIIADEGLLADAAESGAEKARASASKTMTEVRKAIGFA